MSEAKTRLCFISHIPTDHSTIYMYVIIDYECFQGTSYLLFSIFDLLFYTHTTIDTMLFLLVGVIQKQQLTN